MEISISGVDADAILAGKGYEVRCASRIRHFFLAVVAYEKIPESKGECIRESKLNTSAADVIPGLCPFANFYELWCNTVACEKYGDGSGYQFAFESRVGDRYQQGPTLWEK
jgi:hypothetical protein